MRSHRHARNSRNRLIRLKNKLEDAEARKASYGSYNNDVTVGNGRINDNFASFIDRNHGDFHSTTRYSKLLASSKGAVNFNVSWKKPLWSPTRVLRENQAHNLRGYTLPFGFENGSYQSTLSVAMRALFAKIRKDAPSWDILTDAAELPETLGFLRDTASWFGKLVDDVKNRRLRNVMRRLKISTSRGNMRRMHQTLLYGNRHPVAVIDSLQNLLMSYRYAIMPMVYSTRDAFKAFCMSPYKGKENYCFTSQVTMPYEYFTDKVTPYTRSPLSYNVHLQSFEKSSVRLKAYYNYTASLLTRLNLNSWHGLVSAAWEKVKLSWVVDWFISIGEYLQNLNVPDLIPGVECKLTIKGLTSDHLFITDIKVEDGCVLTGMEFNSTTGRNKTFKFSREKVSLTIPDVEINLPSTWFNAKRSIDSACLSWQAVRSNLGGYLEKSTYKIIR